MHAAERTSKVQQ